MKSSGVKRPIDELGRVVIPKDIRKGLGLDARDILNVYTEDNRIIMEKYGNSCIICGNGEDLTEFDGKYICPLCLRRIRNMPE